MTVQNKELQENLSELTFEGAMKRLEEIAKRLENGQATLDESLSLYEEGISLIRFCNDRLVHAEQKVRVLNPAMSED